MTETTTTAPDYELIATASGAIPQAVTAIVDGLRDLLSWPLMGEAEQLKAIHGAEKIVEQIVRDLAKAVVSVGVPSLPVKIEKVSIDSKATKAVITLPEYHDHRATFIDAAGYAATLSLSPADDMRHGVYPKPEADQAELI